MEECANYHALKSELDAAKIEMKINFNYLREDICCVTKEHEALKMENDTLRQEYGLIN